MIILKAGRLAIVENDSKYTVTEYATNGECIFSKPAAGLMEAATLFTDMFCIRVQKWARDKLQKQVNPSANNISHIFGDRLVPMEVGAFRLKVKPDIDLNIFIKNKDRGIHDYGHVLNISNEYIRTHYDQYKKEKEIPTICALSDEERYEFETRVMRALGIEYELRPGWKENFVKEEEEKEKQPV